MVKRVALAVFPIISKWAYNTGHERKTTQEVADEVARVAIAIMREPTEAMLEASGAGYEEIFHKADYAEMWRTMIDAALK